MVDRKRLIRPAGVGKTFLTSRTIDHIQSVLRSLQNDEGFAFFYCSRYEEDRRQPLSVLQRYVRQLSTTVSKQDHMHTKLRKLHHELRLKGSDMSFHICGQYLLELLNTYPKTTLILDALDECEPDSRSRLYETIDFLLEQSLRPVKIFISSRPDGDIRHQFLERPNIEIHARSSQSDIEKFVTETIRTHRRWGRISPSLRNDIVKTLFDRSQGM